MPGFEKTRPCSNRQRLLWRRPSDYILPIRGAMATAAPAGSGIVLDFCGPVEGSAGDSFLGSPNFRRPQAFSILVDENGPELSLLFRLRFSDFGLSPPPVRNSLQPESNEWHRHYAAARRFAFDAVGRFFNRLPTRQP